MALTKKLMIGLAASGMIVAGCGSSGNTSSGTTQAGGGPATSGAGEGTTGSGSHKFIYVTNDPIGVNKFLELGKIGTEAAAKKYGGTAKIYESTDVVSQRSNLDAAVAEKPDAIVLITFDFTDLAEEYAKNNPSQQFLLIDACPAAPPANLHCAVFREYEASYLIGIEAGLLTKTNKTGSVVAVDIPFLHRYSDAFAEGVKSVNSQATDQQLFIGGDNPFSDPAKAKEQALAMAATGADHIFAVGAGSNGGIFEAAKEKNFFSYGVDVNQCPDAPGHIVDNTMKAVDVLVVSEIGKILDGSAAPGSVSSYGLKEAGMDLTSLMEGAADSQCVAVQHPDVLEKVTQVKQDIIDGKLTLKDPMMG